MKITKTLLYRAFGRPRGLLGKLGGRLLARGKDEMTEWVVSGLDVQSTDHVLEVGFGPGVGVKRVAAMTPDGFVAGVDYSHVMVEMASERNADAVVAGRVELRYGAASELPYEDETFDEAFSINSVQVWPDAVAGLREIHRVLRPGGTVVLGFTPIAGQSREDLCPILSRAGFDDVQVDEREIGVRAVASK